MLVDTSVWIDFFNDHASAEAERLSRAIGEGESITLAGIVVTEILLGLRTDSEASRIGDLLQAFAVAAAQSLADYRETARIYRVCRSRGVTIRSTIDCLIAQIAIRDHLPVLTKDRDFRAIAQHFPLEMVVV